MNLRSTRARSQRQHNLRQTHLSSAGTLILDRPRPLTGPAKKPLIFQLPDELLSYIIYLTARDRIWIRNLLCHTLIRIALVCHRFCRITQPMLYRTIGIRCFDDDGSNVVNLHRTLHDNPSLRPFCRKLAFYVSDTKGSSLQDADVRFQLLSEIAAWLPSVEDLHIHGGFELRNDYTWALIGTCSLHMRGLRQLKLSREAWGLYLQPALERLDLPHLKVLDIRGISPSLTEPVKLAAKRHRTATFTSLNLSDYEETPEATAQLLLWPARLIDFRFGSYYDNKYYTDLPMIHSMLLIHKETLRSISIGYLSNSAQGKLLRACDFPNLESLCLSRWSMSEQLESPISDAHLLLGPKLTFFDWSFSIYDQHSEDWNDLGDREVHWIHEFIGEAIHQRAALRKFHITFNPEGHYSDDDDDEQIQHRQGLLEETCHFARSGNINLTCSQPILTKKARMEHKQSLSIERDLDTDIQSVSDASGKSEDDYRSETNQEPTIETLGRDTAQISLNRDIREFFRPSENQR